MDETSDIVEVKMNTHESKQQISLPITVEISKHIYIPFYWPIILLDALNLCVFLHCY